MAYPLIPPKSQWVDSNGDPLVGGYLEFRDPATDALKNTYPTADDADAQTNANSNPVVLDSRGEASIFLENGETYKVTMYDADDVQLWQVDDVAAASAPAASGVTITDSGGYYAASTVEAAFQELGAATGAAVIGIADGGGYFSSTDVEGALQELGPAAAESGVNLKYKTVGTSRDTESLSDDPHLVGFSLTTGSWYAVEAFLDIQNNAAGSSTFAGKFDFTNAYNNAGRMSYQYVNNDETVVSVDATNFGFTIAAVEATSGNFGAIKVDGVFQANATTGGTVDFQWYESASGTITLAEGSYIRMTRLD